MAVPSRHFLDWSRPLLPSVVRYLTESWDGDGPLDLSKLALVAPTAQTGRRLREALTRVAAERDRAMLSPAIITPEVVVSWAQAELPRVATPAEALTAWAGMLQKLDLKEFRALFPVDPGKQDFAWALRAAAQFRRLRRTLGESGRGLREAFRDLPPDNPERARWEALARLEELGEGALAAAGLTDPERARLLAAERPVAPPGIETILLLSVPDPLPLTLRALERLEGVEVRVIIHAPESEAHAFDAWGRPVPDVWEKRLIPLKNEDLYLLPDAEAQAAKLLEILETSASAPPAGARAEAEDDLFAWAAAVSGKSSDLPVAIGLADPEVAFPLEPLAALRGLRVHRPEGRPFRTHELAWVLQMLGRLLHGADFRAAAQLVKMPDVLRFLGRNVEAAPDNPWDEAQFLEDLDHFQRVHLPADLHAAAELAGRFERPRRKRGGEGAGEKTSHLPKALERLQTLVRALEPCEAFSRELRAWLREVFAGKTFSDPEEEEVFAEGAALLEDAIAAAERACSLFAPDLPSARRLDFLLSLVEDSAVYPPRGASDIEAQGWLELPWEDAPVLVVAGMNEGHVPGNLTIDPWLPESLRAHFGLTTNRDRYARDIRLLTGMVESRRSMPGGRVILLAGRESQEREPLQPSRLLLRCPEEELAERTLHLFKGGEETEDSPPPPSWRAAWKWRVPAASVRERFPDISVTHFADWLRCPFRFYLKHVLQMDPWDEMKAEMDHRDFGNLIHHAMEELHADSRLRDSTDAEELGDFLVAKATEEARRLYGRVLTLPLLAQLDAARGRLRQAAAVHAKAREEGWRTAFTEVRFDQLPGRKQRETAGGLPLKGRIDLIERRPDTKEIRILDYKTSSSGKKPAAAHLKLLRGPSQPRELHPWEICTDKGKAHRWLNLQLPLYAAAAHRAFPDEKVVVGYFNLPRDTGATEIQIWDPEELTMDLIESAEVCAAGIVGEILAGRFWNPSQRAAFDDYGEMFFGDLRGTVDPEELLALAEAGAR